MDAAVAGVIGLALGAIGGILVPIVNVALSRKAEHDKWKRNMLQKIYSESIDCLADSPMNCSEAKKWLNLLLIYHSSRDTIEYLDLYDRISNLNEKSPDWMAKELTATIIETAASDNRLMGEKGTGNFSAAYWASLGKNSFDRKKYVDAYAYFNNALKANQKYSLAHYYKGKICSIYNKNSEAIICYDEAIKNNPRCYQAVYNKAKIYINLSEYNEAKKCLEKVTSINPECADAYYDLHTTLTNLGEKDAAERAYQKAIKINPDIGISG